MASNQPPPGITIASLRGGVDSFDPALALGEDTCEVAENVEFYSSTCGQRRKGCTAISLPATITGDATLNTISWMGRHLPTSDSGDAELWVLAQNLTAANNLLTHRTKTAWTTVVPVDAITTTTSRGYQVNGQTLHKKFFIAYKSAQDRLHVWDGTSLRRTGLAEPATPTAANSGSGSYATLRYFRVRYTEIAVSGAVLRRSEPSDSLAFTPSGSGSGATLTKPVAINEGETHWEIEASTDDANYYRIAVEPIATTTYIDMTPFSPGYASATDAILSEDIGSYTLVPSGRYVAIDDDRLIMGGSWENDDYASRVWWTPVNADPGVGNDERLALDSNPYIDLDGAEGGSLTGVIQGTTGYIFAFKRSRIYKLVRTGNVTHAYEPYCLTRARGAFPGSLIQAVDENGQSCLYFLDPSVGPCRLGAKGLEWCGYDVQSIWDTVNADAPIVCHGIYYPHKNQVHWWLSVNGASYPNFKLILHTTRCASTDSGVRKGWVTVPQGDRIAEANCSVMFSPNIDSTDPRSVVLVPFVGKPTWTVLGVTITSLVQRCDAEDTDAFVTGDMTAYYRGRVRTKPYLTTGALFGVLVGSIIARASEGAVITLRLVKDFNVDDPVEVDIDCTAERSEEYIIRLLSDLGIAELFTCQIEFGDLRLDENPDDYWDVVQIALKTTGGHTQ